MKVSLKWLSDYVEVPTDIKEFCDRLDLTGTGVEGVEKTGAQFDGVVVGHVLTCEEHPDSDHMHVVTVDVGAGEPVQIVCGAPNIAADIKVPVATVGAVLPGDFKIKKSKLRGVASMGMCCSKRELGMGADHSGIWVLPDDAPVGQPIADYLGLATRCSTWRSPRTARTACLLRAWRAKWALCTSAIGTARLPKWQHAWSFPAKATRRRPTPPSKSRTTCAARAIPRVLSAA